VNNCLTYRSKGLQSGIFGQGSKGFVSLDNRMYSGYMAMSWIIEKGISQMGTTYFLLLVAVCLGASLLILRRVNSRSYIFGEKGEAVDYETIKAAKRVDQYVHPNETAFVEWFTRKLERESSRQDQAIVGTALLANESRGEAVGAQSQAIH